jgi:hypothetical protein
VAVERILFPDVAAAVIGALTTQLPALSFSSTGVYSRVPNPRPSRFVLVFRTGGSRANLVTDGAQLTFEAWASSDAEAHDLAQAVRAIVGGLEHTLTGSVPIYGVDELAGPVNLPDPTSDQSRFTFSAVVNARGVAA